MKLHRVVITWQGACINGAAVTVLHFDGSNQTAPPVAAITSAFNALNAVLPDSVTFTVPNTGDSIEDTTGALSGVWSGTGGQTIGGHAAGPVAAGVGACVSWTTGGIVNGTKGPRKLRGRTFIAPMGTGYFEANGTLSAAGLGAVDAFGTQLRAAGPLAVWHRPTKAAPASGNSYAVITHRVRDKVAYLSSRRD